MRISDRREQSGSLPNSASFAHLTLINGTPEYVRSASASLRRLGVDTYRFVPRTVLTPIHQLKKTQCRLKKARCDTQGSRTLKPYAAFAVTYYRIANRSISLWSRDEEKKFLLPAENWGLALLLTSLLGRGF